MRTRQLKTAACLLGLGTAALVAQPASAAVGDHQTTLKETLSTGAASANPDMSLNAMLESADGKVPVSTGSILYRIDASHLAPGAWKAIQNAPHGTRLGTFSSVVTGSHPTAVRLQGPARDANGPLVRATIGIESSLSKGVGSSIVPITLRRSSDTKFVTVAVNLQTPVGKLIALGLDSTVREAVLKIQGTIAYGGALHPITLNPTKLTPLTNMVSTQACAQPACTTLRPAIDRSVATVHLPKQVTLTAPDVLSYGFRYSIGGTGRPGDHISLAALGSDGSLIPSPWGADVRPDGTFEVRATVRSEFGADDELVRPAAARYAASATEGNATVLAIAPNDTHVRLVKPMLNVQRKHGGSRLHFAVKVPGADPNVNVRIQLGKRTIAEGKVNKAGRYSITVASPIAKGNLRAVATVGGADTAISDPISFSTS
jgi:hypothetical protein